MIKKRFSFIAGTTAVGSMVAAMAGPSVFPTGVTVYDPTSAYNSYVIFGGPDHRTRLIDMNGNVVHEWAYAGFPSLLLDPKINGGKIGHVLLQLTTDERAGAGIVPHMPAEFRNRTIGEQDWDGKTVWEWGQSAPGGAARQHHDWFREANGNTVILSNSFHPIPGFKLASILDDVIYEIAPGGKILWEWQASDHLGEIGFTLDQLELLHDVKTPDYLHVNNMTAVGPNRWFDAGDKRFAPDNILFDSRNANFIAIIDRRSGHIVWTLGPNFPSASSPSSEVPRAVDQISGQHDAHLIEPGLPGAGNLIVFDNQGGGGYPPVALGVNSGSRVLEIDPEKKQIVWQYSAENSGRPGWTFFSSFISSARRLPNGNTLIDEGMNGRFFQITPKGKIVWEYVSPFFAPSPVGSTADPVNSNWVYRAQPVPYDWVPAGTPHSQRAVDSTNLAAFHVGPTS